MVNASSPEFTESLRHFLSSPIPGEGLVITGDGLEYDVAMNPNRYDDLNYATELLRTYANGEEPDLPPASFRADTVLFLASALGSEFGRNHLEDDEIVEADRLIFRGGKTKWLGLELETVPIFDKILEEKTGNSTVSSKDVAKHIFDSLGGMTGINLFGAEVTDRLVGNEVSTVKSSMAGQLIMRLLKTAPSEIVRESDLQLLLEHYEQTGQILLGTNDQFVQAGDVKKGSPAFWLLQLKEAEQQPLSQKQNSTDHTETIVKFYEDGSRKTEEYDLRNHSARLIYETPGISSMEGVKLTDEDPILSVVAGYEVMSKIPYLPEWMKDSEAAGYPTTVLLDVYPNRYVMTIRN